MRVGSLPEPIGGADAEVATKRAAPSVHHKVMKLPASRMNVAVLGRFAIVGGGQYEIRRAQ